MYRGGCTGQYRHPRQAVKIVSHGIRNLWTESLLATRLAAYHNVGHTRGEELERVLCADLKSKARFWIR